MTVRRSMAWMFAGQVVSAGAQLIGTIVLARLLSPREMGIFAFAFAISGLVLQGRNLGLSGYIQPQLPSLRFIHSLVVPP